MKKIIILLALILLSCSEYTNTDDCNCNENTYYNNKIIQSEYYSNNCLDDGKIIVKTEALKVRIDCK